jgi:hypothetical protein
MYLQAIVASSIVLAAAMLAPPLMAADGPLCVTPEQAPPCECVTHSCKLVPEKKQIKKTVYEVQCVPYCLKKLPPICSLFHHHGCDCELCAECQCPRYKKVLVKKEVVCKEICTSKCVIEEHKVPCQPCECCSK